MECRKFQQGTGKSLSKKQLSEVCRLRNESTKVALMSLLTVCEPPKWKSGFSTNAEMDFRVLLLGPWVKYAPYSGGSMRYILVVTTLPPRVMNFREKISQKHVEQF